MKIYCAQVSNIGIQCRNPTPELSIQVEMTEMQLMDLMLATWEQLGDETVTKIFAQDGYHFGKIKV
jgi:hypothetical protein